MAPFDDALCGSSAVANPLTSLLKQDSVDRSLHQDRLLNNSDAGVAQTMRSGSREPTTKSQGAFDAFKNQDAALQLVAVASGDRSQEPVNLEEAWAAAGEERPFAGQYAEVDELLKHRSDPRRSETEHQHDRMDSAPCSYGGRIDSHPPLREEHQRLSRDHPAWTYASYQLAYDVWHFGYHGKLADFDSMHNPDFLRRPYHAFTLARPGQPPSHKAYALHYLGLYRAAVQDNLLDLRAAAIGKLTSQDLRMPDVNAGLLRRDRKLEVNEVLPIHEIRLRSQLQNVMKAVWHQVPQSDSEPAPSRDAEVSQGLPRLSFANRSCVAGRPDRPLAGEWWDPSPSEIVRHSVMFRFLDALYSSPPPPVNRSENPPDSDHGHNVCNLHSDQEGNLLRKPILLRQALNILKMEDSEELRMLRDRHPKLQEELCAALKAVRQEYEEIVVDEHGNLTLRVTEGEWIKAKL